MNIAHIFLCLILALTFTLLHFIARPLTLTGIFENFKAVTLVGLIFPAVMVLISQTVFRKAIGKIDLLTATKKQLLNLRALHVGNWSMLMMATIVSIVFYFAANAGAAVALVGILTLLLLYSSKPDYST